MTAVAETNTPVETEMPPRPKLGRLMMIELALLLESPDNPRKHFDEAELDDLATSLRTNGVLNELKVRPHPTIEGSFEIGAGARRRRAAERAGLWALPCIVKDMGDQEFLELIIVENDQRSDIHPLEEAEGYKLLVTRYGLDAAEIADRVGRNTQYVTDRLQLLNLIPEAQKIFLQKRMLIGHAVILAKLDSEWQEKAIAPELKDPNSWQVKRGGLWSEERSRLDPDQEDMEIGDDPKNPYEGLKPVTVAELQTWVNDHVRLAVDEPELVALDDDETAAKLIDIAESEVPTKIVHITYDYRVPDAARDPDKRTYGREHWKRADGEEDSKECEHVALGVVVAGPRRSKSFLVCVARDRCEIHWKKEIAEAARRRKNTQTSTSRGGAAASAELTAAQKKQQEKDAQAAKAAELALARHTKALPAIKRAAEIGIGRAPAAKLIALVMDEKHDRLENLWGVSMKRVAKAKTADAFLRTIAVECLQREIEEPYDYDECAAILKALGVDYGKLLDEHAPIAEKGDPKKPAKKAKKK